MARIAGSYPDDLDLLVEGVVEAGVFGAKSDALCEFVREYFEDHENERIVTAVALYERERITLGDAARLADVGRWTMRDILREHGVELRLGLVDGDDPAYEGEAAIELENGVGGHPYLWTALDTLDDGIPVARISDTVANREAVVSDHLDAGEVQAFALSDAEDGRLLTDDGNARSFARDQGVTVAGSVGVLLAAIDTGKIEELTANEWLSAWIGEIGYYVLH